MQLKFVKAKNKSIIEDSHVSPKGVCRLPFRILQCLSLTWLDVCQMCNKRRKYRFTIREPFRIVILSPEVITVQGDECVSRVVSAKALGLVACAHSDAQETCSLLEACVDINPRNVISLSAVLQDILGSNRELPIRLSFE